MHHNATAVQSDTFPVTKWRCFVLGFRPSSFRSTIRLKIMAQVRAVTIANKMSENNLQPGQPFSGAEATTIDAKANGRAKTVCEN